MLDSMRRGLNIGKTVVLSVSPGRQMENLTNFSRYPPIQKFSTYKKYARQFTMQNLRGFTMKNGHIHELCISYHIRFLTGSIPGNIAKEALKCIELFFSFLFFTLSPLRTFHHFIISTINFRDNRTGYELIKKST